MNIAEKAFSKLFPEKQLDRVMTVKYSGRFKGYNANVKYTGRELNFFLSRQWKGVSEEIKIGLLQELLMKVYREKIKTDNIDLYNMFIKNIANYTPSENIEPELLDSFNRVNSSYFFGLIETPNLVWGSHSTQKLGSYDYGSDIISISRVLKGKQELLDYVMYHEMLHKKHKYKHTGLKNMHHTRKFRDDEKKFENAKEIEEKLNSLVFRKRLSRSFKFW